MNLEPTVADLIDVARRWRGARDRIVKVRETHEESGFFAVNQGTHLTFIDELMKYAQELGGLLPSDPRDVIALRELITSRASELEAGFVR
jgi:hypothetical protein